MADLFASSKVEGFPSIKEELLISRPLKSQFEYFI